MYVDQPHTWLNLLKKVLLLHHRSRRVTVVGREDVDLLVSVGFRNIPHAVEDRVGHRSLAVEVEHFHAGDGGQAFGALAQGDADIALAIAAVMLIFCRRRPHAVALHGLLRQRQRRRRRRCRRLDLVFEQKRVARKLAVFGFRRPQVGRFRDSCRRCGVVPD